MACGEPDPHRSLEQFNAQGLDFTQHVQTNATLINDAWCTARRLWPGGHPRRPPALPSTASVVADAMEQPERMYRFLDDVDFLVDQEPQLQTVFHGANSSDPSSAD